MSPALAGGFAAAAEAVHERGGAGFEEIRPPAALPGSGRGARLPAEVCGPPIVFLASAAAEGLTGERIASLGKGEAVTVVVDGDDARVERGARL